MSDTPNKLNIFSVHHYTGQDDGKTGYFKVFANALSSLKS